jgi:hypothetical protein
MFCLNALCNADAAAGASLLTAEEELEGALWSSATAAGDIEGPRLLLQAGFALPPGGLREVAELLAENSTQPAQVTSNTHNRCYR